MQTYTITNVMQKEVVRCPPHGARPVHLIITMIKWIRTSRLSIKNTITNVMQQEVVRALPPLQTRNTVDEYKSSAPPWLPTSSMPCLAPVQCAG